MGDIPVPQARYALLHNHNNRKYCCAQHKFILCTLFLAVTAFLVLSIYIATVGIYEKILYPRYSTIKDVQSNWTHKAAVYAQIQNISYDYVEKHSKFIEKHTFIKNYRLVCYYNFPNENAVDNYLKTVLKGGKIDPFLCTHVIVGFLGVSSNSTVVLNDFQARVLEEVVDLKKFNKDLKVLISVGGAGDDANFPTMVLNHQNRKSFIESVEYYLKKYKLDGIDLDWEFPNRDPKWGPKQKMHFTQLLHEFREEINRQERHKFLLSVAVAAPVILVDISYDVYDMNDAVDFVNLMAYDFHSYTKFTPFTGINSPLYSKPDDVGVFSTLSINYSANYWVRKGMDRAKINIGLPTYGHSFRLTNARNNGIGAPALGFGKLGENGFISYNDACWFLNKNQIKPIFDNDFKSPYATLYNEWVSFDDITSLTFKAEYVKNNNFGGAMVYSLNTDDHDGLCKQVGNPKTPVVRFPLISTVKTVLSDQQL